jgi:drug/metabolite transporter (DMT)-like permease
MPPAVIPLGYEPPQPKASGAAATAIIFVAMFICGSALGIFAIEVDGRRSSIPTDSWPAAVAVLGLAFMGTCIAFFLTRRR